MERIPIRELRKADLDAIYDAMESMETSLITAKNKLSMLRVENAALKKENLSLKGELSRFRRIANALRRSVNME